MFSVFIAKHRFTNDRVPMDIPVDRRTLAVAVGCENSVCTNFHEEHVNAHPKRQITANNTHRGLTEKAQAGVLCYMNDLAAVRSWKTIELPEIT